MYISKRTTTNNYASLQKLEFAKRTRFQSWATVSTWGRKVAEHRLSALGTKIEELLVYLSVNGCEFVALGNTLKIKLSSEGWMVQGYLRRLKPPGEWSI